MQSRFDSFECSRRRLSLAAIAAWTNVTGLGRPVDPLVWNTYNSWMRYSVQKEALYIPQEACLIHRQRSPSKGTLFQGLCLKEDLRGVELG